MGKITKADLIDSVYKSSKYERQTVQAVVNDFLNELKSGLEKGNSIELRGFGTFETRLRKGRKVARNPKTNEGCTVPPHYTAAFRPGQELKKSLLELNISADEKKSK